MPLNDADQPACIRLEHGTAAYSPRGGGIDRDPALRPIGGDGMSRMSVPAQLVLRALALIFHPSLDKVIEKSVQFARRRLVKRFHAWPSGWPLLLVGVGVPVYHWLF